MSEPVVAAVPAYYIPKLLDQISTMNKRARRLGCTEIVYKVARETTPVSVFVGKDEHGRDAYEDVPGHEVTIIGSLPKYSGWRLIASIQLIDGHQIIKTVPGFEVPRQYWDAIDYCEHCNSRNRKRTAVFILKHDDGTYKQVGRSCIADFLGHGSPEKFLFNAFVIPDLLSSMRDYDECAGGRTRTEFWLKTVVFPLAFAVIREDGWVSRAMSDENPSLRPTSALVSTLLHPTNTADQDVLAWRRARTPTDGDRSDSELTFDWALSLNPTNEYLHNVKTLCEIGYTDSRNLGLAVSIVAAYQRHIGQEIIRRRQTTSVFVGTVKQRKVFDLTVTNAIAIEGSYGTSILHVMMDADGNVFTWKASNESLKVGQTYRLKGTIKEHTEYKGVKQTVLSRCTLQSLEG